MCANPLHSIIARREIDERVCQFGCVTFALIQGRNAVGDFGDTFGIGWTGETAHAHKNVVNFVDRSEPELPWIGLARGLPDFSRNRMKRQGVDREYHLRLASRRRFRTLRDCEGVPANAGASAQLQSGFGFGSSSWE